MNTLAFFTNLIYNPDIVIPKTIENGVKIG